MCIPVVIAFVRSGFVERLRRYAARSGFICFGATALIVVVGMKRGCQLSRGGEKVANWAAHAT